jgi:GH25 family lysozyme M1 (1,4-beta-N-acetylmuramidase)
MLFWEPEQMMESVKEYHVFRNNSFYAATTQRAINDINICIGGTYQYKVAAFTYDGNYSPFSNIVAIYITPSPGIIYWALANQCSGFLKGIDVSKYIPELDWTKIKEDGISFAYVRAAGAKLFQGYDPDPMALKHARGIKSAGLPVGFYFIPLWSSKDYSINMAKIDARSYANHIFCIMNQIGYNGYGDLLPVLDIESALTPEQIGLTGAQIVHWARVFCDEFKSYTGRTIMIYTSRFFWQEVGITEAMNSVKDLPLWTAEYYQFNDYLNYTDTPVKYGGWKGWTLWLYSQTAVVAGYSGMDTSWCRNLDLIMPPLKPQNLTGCNICSRTVMLDWDMNREIDIIGYNIFRDGRYIARTKDTCFYDCSGLHAGKTYTYEVQAVDIFCDVSPSACICIYICM